MPAEWRAIVARLGLTEARIGRLVRLAARNRTSFQVEMMASGYAREIDICREIARELGLPLVVEVDPDRLVMQTRHRAAALRGQRGVPHAMVREAGGRLAVLASPARIELAELRKLLTSRPGLVGRVRIVLPSALRRAIVAASRTSLDDNARNKLFVERHELSARNVLNGWQGVFLGGVLVALPTGLILNWPATWIVIHVVFSFFFMACVVLRAIVAISARPLSIDALKPYEPAELPVYTVLVALYREAQIVPQLMVALSKINWPRSKLEIKLVCEADDSETLAALKALRLHPCVEIIEVPPGNPRTKPKALSYALPMSSGEYVTLFDAEDRPHEDQLLEAWQRFRMGDQDIACLQAPLVITNAHAGAIPLMFAFEYAALFRGILPWLARNRLVLPLGGTSNHFRRSALEEVGGWDGFNVTEDADLGIRLARFGYRCETITRPTLEDAPEELVNWGKQRTRWFKGWMQTWLVHMRQPARLAGQIGGKAFGIVQILVIGMIVSALANVVFLGTILWIMILLATSGGIGTFHSALLGIDLANILGGYIAFVVLGLRTLGRREASAFWKVALLTPTYWLAMSLAAWRAVWQLYWRPHHWEKTHHPVSLSERSAMGRSR